MHFNPKTLLRLKFYAWFVILGYCINGMQYQIGFSSRTLTQPDRDYTQLEKTFLALVFAVSRFRNSLYKEKVTLVTDPKPFRVFFDPGKHTRHMTAAKIHRASLYS